MRAGLPAGFFSRSPLGFSQVWCVRDGLLDSLAADVSQYTAVWSERGRLRFTYQGAREDGRSPALFDGIPLVEIPDRTARGRLFRKRITRLSDADDYM